MLTSEAAPNLPEMQVAPSGRMANASACEDRLWEQLSRNTSVFGRLVAIAEMGNRESRRYECPLGPEFAPDLVDRTLREMHREVFGMWLGFRLQQQQRDLTVWLASLSHGVAEGLQNLQAISKRLSTLLPPHHVESERQLFFQDFQLVSTTIRWADVEAGIWFWPETEESAETEKPSILGRVRGWFK